MTLRFRNLDFDVTQPIDQWPAEAIETIMDRGSLSDWRQLAKAIRLNPWGPAARTTETIVDWGEHYGVDVLMGNVICHAREENAKVAPTTDVLGRLSHVAERSQGSSGV